MSEARTTKGTTEERVQRFTALLDKALPKIESTEPITGIGKVSPVESALEPIRDRICAQIDRGYKPGTIARIIKQGDELDDTFAQETIRLAILRIAGRSTKPETPTTKSPRKGHKTRSSDGSRDAANDGSNVGNEATTGQHVAQSQAGRSETQAPEQFDPMAFYKRPKITEDEF